jgi:hypothetical protein
LTGVGVVGAMRIRDERPREAADEVAVREEGVEIHRLVHAPEMPRAPESVRDPLRARSRGPR